MMFSSRADLLPLGSLRASSPTRAHADKQGGGRLAIEFTREGGGRTFVFRQYACYPFHICRAQYHDAGLPGLATLYIQSCAGGLFENDRLRIDVVAGPLAEAHLTSQASTIVHGATTERSEQRATILAQDGAYLEYLPDPHILFPGSNLESSTTVVTGGSGCVLACDSFLTHDPTASGGLFSSFESETVVEDEGGRRLAIDRVRIDEQLAAAKWVGVAGQFGAQGTFIIVNRNGPLEALAASLKQIAVPYSAGALGISFLSHSAGVIVRMLARDGIVLRFLFKSVWSASRFLLKGDVPHIRRK